ncbi:hypothetical protein [Galbibacter mesophilus]|uniref:hypothetical protein n=1 Tax=Galbibacter mesophilus TaxID=379069 RepID=UPI00191E7B20|nr:hypothetical protein [Galbibacter mesophilus]MCM5664203.1 hypothetical protein [Galbibacter mesophilus]
MQNNYNLVRKAFTHGGIAFLFIFLPLALGAQTPIESINASYVDVNNSSNDYTIKGNGSHPNYAAGTDYTLQFSTSNTTQNNYELSKTASFVAGGKTFDAAFLVDKFFVRRNGTAGGNQRRQILWFERENTNNSTNTRALRPSYAGSIEESFRSLRLNIGSDNTFVNPGGDGSGGSAQVNNIERFDYINSEGISTATPANAGFAVFERNGNDPFKIAAVLSIDADGNPTKYGTLKAIPASAFGTKSFHDTNYVIFQRQDSDSRLKPAENGGPQRVAGTFISLTDLGIVPNQVFYGYIIMPNDAITPDWTQSPTNTNSTQGGMDAYPGGGFYDSDGGLQQVNANNDADNDGIPNTSDLDDDNDGILDLNEGLDCATSNLRNTKALNTDYGKDAVTNIATYKTVKIDVTSTISSGATFNKFRFETGIAGNTEGLLLNTSNTNFDTAPTTHTFQFNQSVTNVNIDLGDIDESDVVEIKAFNGANRIKLSNSNFVVLNPANVNNDGAKTVSSNNPNNIANTSNAGNVTITIGQAIDKLVFKVGKSGPAGAVQISFSNIKYCIPTDTDQDGILDYLDVDSDNDGIYDAVEAGHGGAHSNGRLTATVGTDGIADSVQDSPNAGTVNYTVLSSDTDGKPDFQDLDSDADGCLDVLEAGFTENPDKPGQLLGNTVNSNGKVAGNTDGYTQPQDLNGNTTFDYRETTPKPVIAGQPQSKTIFTGDSVFFNVAAKNSNAYQWQIFNGTTWDDISNTGIYSGATTDELTITKTPNSLNGKRFRVIVINTNNACGELLSNEAVLTVNVKTVITNRNTTYRVNN